MADAEMAGAAAASTEDVPPCQTVYVANLSEKLKKEGEKET